jgi:hypothetical protein
VIPSVGRTVHLRLSASCAEQINRRRSDAQANGIREDGAQAHIGNPVKEGDVFPLLITKVWGDEPTESTAVNGQVFLDGNDCLWATSVVQGDGPGQWFEPPRVPATPAA